jgi:AcrR family transcriptional regulator
MLSRREYGILYTVSREIISTSDQILEAASALMTKRGGADVTMAEIAKAAKLSRQAVYLHFADRAELLLSLARYVDEKRGIGEELRKLREAASGVEALGIMVSIQVRMNPGIWAIARAVDAVRRTDADAERTWQDRLKHRLEGCKEIVGRLQKEGSLRKGLDPQAAADLLWTITSLRMYSAAIREADHRITAVGAFGRLRGLRACEPRSAFLMSGRKCPAEDDLAFGQSPELNSPRTQEKVCGETG